MSDGGSGKKKKSEEASPGAPMWMVTFSDMVTILLAFFVMIVAMSEVQVQQFRQALSNFPGHTGLLQQEAAVASPTRPQPIPVESSRDRAVEQRLKMDALTRFIDNTGLDSQIDIQQTDAGIRFTLSDAILFPPGSANLNEDGIILLSLIGTLIDESYQEIIVEGHTDSIPINSARFPSNWELSSSRASAVIRLFLEQPGAQAPDRYIAIGRGAYSPLVPNNTPENRARNRRVDIFFNSEPWLNKTQNPQVVVP